MSEFLKSIDEQLAKTVKDLSGSISSDNEQDNSNQQQKVKPSISEKREQKPSKKEPEVSISEELSRRYKKEGRSLTLWLLGTKSGIMTIIGVIAFVAVWLLAGFWWAIGAVALCFAIYIGLSFLFDN